MKICIYRGTDEVGGNCVEISTDTTRIILDVGTPLSSMEMRAPYARGAYRQWLARFRTGVTGLYSGDDCAPVDAVFISHNHGDHYGLLPLVRGDVPVFTSPTLRQILTEIEPLKGARFDVSHLDIHDIVAGHAVTIGDLTVTAHPVDHSPAAMAFEITDGRTRVLYTGDIRFHSTQAYRSIQLATNVKNPDYLIMEGTRLSRDDVPDAFPTELSVRRALTELFSASGRLAFICLSAQNLDRLCSLFSACRRAGRTLVIKPYTAELLRIFHELSPRVPRADTAAFIRVFYGDKTHGVNARMGRVGMLDRYADREITMDEIIANPAQFVVEHNYELTDELIAGGIVDYDYVYSMWHGYLDRQSTWDAYKDHLIEIHSSGHAMTRHLKRFVHEIAPRVIIPIHTECKDKYYDTFGVPTLVLQDNESKEL